MNNIPTTSCHIKWTLYMVDSHVLAARPVLVIKTTKHFQKPQPVHLSADPVQWFDTGHYLGVTLILS
jgi:hypothetical protein